MTFILLSSYLGKIRGIVAHISSFIIEDLLTTIRAEMSISGYPVMVPDRLNDYLMLFGKQLHRDFREHAYVEMR